MLQKSKMISFLSPKQGPVGARYERLMSCKRNFFLNAKNLGFKLPVSRSMRDSLRCCTGKSDYKMEEKEKEKRTELTSGSV